MCLPFEIPNSQHERRYVQAVPNNAFYKRPIVVQRLQNPKGRVFRHCVKESRKFPCAPDLLNIFGTLEVGLSGLPAPIDFRLLGVEVLVFRMFGLEAPSNRKLCSVRHETSAWMTSGLDSN